MFKKFFNLNKIIPYSILAIPTTYADTKANIFDDWVVEYGCYQRANKLCTGYYSEPSYAELDSYPSILPIQITADSVEITSSNVSNFKGNVLAKQGNKHVYADFAVITSDPNTGDLKNILANGNVKLMQPGLRIDGVRANLDETNKTKNIFDANFRYYPRHARGQAKKIEIIDDNILKMEKASYTTCAPNNNSWLLKAKTVKLNKAKGRGESTHTKLYLNNIPVFYAPYFNFPIDNKRHSGFLLPQFQSSNIDGISIAIPYYFNIAPNYDYTITPRYMSKRGLKFANEYRYLTTINHGKLDFNFLFNDKAYKNYVAENIAVPRGISQDDLRHKGLRYTNFRYLFGFKNYTNLASNLFLEIDFNKTSDDNYLYDFENDTNENIATTSLLQQAKLNYYNNLGSLTFNLQQYQTLHPYDGPVAEEAYKKLPEIDFQSNDFFPYNNFEGLFSFNFTDFKKKAIDYPNYVLGITAKRTYLKPSFAYEFLDTAWSFTPKIQLDHLRYDDLNNNLSSSSRTIPVVSLDLKTFFERDSKIFNDYFIQTLEPRIKYLYVPNRLQDSLPVFDSGVYDFDYYQVFRDNRYSGLDRQSEANQVSLGITKRFINSNSGEEQLNLNIGIIRYLRNLTPRLDELQELNLDRRWSPFAMRVDYKLQRNMELEASWVTDGATTKQAGFNLQYKQDNTNVFNIGYEHRRVEEQIRQFNTSVAWDINSNIRLLGKYSYDLNNSRTLNNIAGFEYHSCCTILRLVFDREYRVSGVEYQNQKYDNRVRLQLVLKGLTDAGNLRTGYLTEEISGYIPDDNI